MERSLAWRKSSFSGPGETNDCIELAALDGEIRIRESDTPAAAISVAPARLGTFIRACKAGVFDHIAG